MLWGESNGVFYVSKETNFIKQNGIKIKGYLET